MPTDKEKITHLKELLKKAENDCKLLEERKEYYKQKCRNLIADNEKKTTEILDLFTRNQGQTIDLLNRKGRIIDLEKVLKDVNAQYAELEINHWALQANHDNLQHNLNLGQQEIRELEEAGGALLNVFYNKEQKLQSSQLDLNELLERFNHSENTLESKNRFIIRLAQESNQKNQLVNQLQNLLNTTEAQRDNYLNDLNELEADGRVREEILANKNAELAVLQLHTCSPCSLNHLPEPHQCPIVNKIECSHSDYETIKQQRDNYQQQLSNQEQAIIRRLNVAFNMSEKDLQGIISKLKELIDKPPLTITDDINMIQTIKQELTQAHQIVTKLEKQLTEKTVGKKIETIIKIDEKLLNENANLNIELNKQSQDYEQLAQERNRLVLQQIKDINVIKLQQLIPNAQEKVIRQNLQKARNYEELSQERNKMIVEYINQNTQQNLTSPKQLPLNNHSERVILISLLVVSLMSIGGLLVKLRGARKA